MQVSKFEALTRAGFAARGVLYILIGFLASWIGHAEGAGGTLEYLNSGSGKLLIGVMAIGFVGYGAWRLSEALLDTEGNGTAASGIAKRAAGFVAGLIYLGLAVYAALLASGWSGGGGSANEAEYGAATALALPGGRTVLAVAAGLLVATGLYQLAKVRRLGFLHHLERKAARQDWVRWSGALGYSARGVTFLIVAWLAWKAARAGSSKQAGETGEALQWLPESLQIVVGGGLALFGVFSLVEARYRRINDPRVIDRLASKARSARW